MPEPTSPCPACLGSAEFWGQKTSHYGYACSGCGTVHFVVAGRTTNVSADELYADRYTEAAFKLESAAEDSLLRVVRSSEPFRDTGRWLDIGFGEGGLLSIVARHGWTCFGTEMASSALAYGARNGWIVGTQIDDDPRFPNAGFDVVSMVEFIEHTTTPDHFMKLAARKLRAGGCFYLTTPNARSLNSRLLGLGWSVFAPPEHCVIWSARGLRHTLARFGLSPWTVRAEGFNPVEILIRARRRGAHPTVAELTTTRNRAGFAMNAALSRKASGRWAKRVANLGLSALRLGDTLKMSAIRAPVAD